MVSLTGMLRFARQRLDGDVRRDPWRLPSRPWWSRWLAYLLSIASTAAALQARLALGDTASGKHPALTLLLVSVILCAWLGGLGPGLVATVLGTLAGDYFLLAPIYSLAIADYASAIALVSFSLAGVLVSVVSEILHRGRRRAEDSRLGQGFLGKAAVALASSPNYTKTLETVAELAVEGLATMCLFYLIDENGSIELVASAHPDPELAQRLVGAERFLVSERCGVTHAVLRAIDSGHSLIVPRVDETWIAANATSDDHERLMRELDYRSLLVVPVTGLENRVLGALLLVLTAPGEGRYDQRDLEFAQELTWRVGIAVERARLYAHELEYHRLIETTNDGIMKLDLRDPRACISQANQRMIEFLGYADAAEVQGRSVFDFVDPADVAEVEQRFAHRRQGKSERYEVRLRRRDGAVLWTLCAASPLVDRHGAVTSSLCVLTNISERKQTERQLVFLADTRSLFASSLSSEKILTQLAELVVERKIADWCIVYCPERGDTFTAKAAAYRDPAKRAAFIRRQATRPVGVRTITARVLRTGEPVFVAEYGLEHLKAAAVDGERRQHSFDFHSLIAVPLSARGQTFGVLVMLNAESPQAFSDKDFALAKSLGSRAGLGLDNARLFEQGQRDAAFQRFIAHASEVLSSSLDLPTTLDGLLRLVVPEFAQWGIVNLIDEHDGTAKAAAVIHANPHKAQLANRLRGHSYLRVEASQVPHASSTSQIVARADETFIRAVVRPEFVPTLMEIELGSSLVIVPLVARGLLLGALMFAAGQAEDRRVYTVSDLPLFEELARRAAVAILHARDFAQERRVADFLQSTSLPLALPQCPGLRFHAFYEAGKSDAQVGGDWYDALRLPDGRILISIGDVLGSGVEAAITMASLRQIVRGVVQIDPDPGVILEAADRALHSEHPERFATAFVGLFDPITALLRYACAGHPRPLLWQPDSAIAELTGGHSLPLGLREYAPAEPEANVVLPPGSLLVLYTDGLTEATHDPSEGEQRLVAALGDAAVRESSNVARALQAAVLRQGSRDDVAVLVLAIETVADGCKRDASPNDEAILAWTFDAHDAKAARATRGFITHRLRTHTASDDECHAAEVVFGELVSNVVRHAPGPIEVRLEVGGQAPILHVLDQGPGFQHVAQAPVTDLMSETGRGLSVVAALTAEFNVSRRARPLSGSHARAVLSVNRGHAGAR